MNRYGLLTEKVTESRSMCLYLTTVCMSHRVLLRCRHPSRCGVDWEVTWRWKKIYVKRRSKDPYAGVAVGLQSIIRET